MRFPLIATLLTALLGAAPARAQVPPSPAEIAAYTGLHAAAARDDVPAIAALLRTGADANARDEAGRTPLHVAAFGARYDAVLALVGGGADPRAKENRRYDIVTIAAVRNDTRMLRLALKLGADPRAITSPYDGTALIAAAHLGHAEIVAILIEAGAPLDHVNNLGWTAVVEAIVLGDGGTRHLATLRALVRAGARLDIADRDGARPLVLAQRRGFAEMVALLESVGAR